VKDFIKNEIEKYVIEGENNWFSEIDGHWFEKPLVQFASAEDPLFKEYKKIIGAYHQAPQEAFELSFGEGSYQGGTVISIVLPINEKIRQSNGRQTIWPSQEWALLRTHEVAYFKEFTHFLIDLLQAKGYKTMSPSQSEWFEIMSAVPNGPSSNWSERHVAYVAGLGTFSINDAFITEKGIAVKLLSVVTELKLEPDRREAKSHTENCLLCSKGTCGACIKRCPVNAISAEGHDKMKCAQYTYGEESKKLAQSYGGDFAFGAGCGLCQTHVPCQSRNPMKRN